MRVSVVSAWQVLYEGNAQEALLPGEDGELCVLDFHHPLIARLRQGVVQILSGWQRSGARAGRRHEVAFRMPINDGIARMTGNELVILVDINFAPRNVFNGKNPAQEMAQTRGAPGMPGGREIHSSDVRGS